MLQEERKIPVGSVTSSTTSSLSSDMSVIHHKNKVELIQDYFDEAKKYDCVRGSFSINILVHVMYVVLVYMYYIKVCKSSTQIG